MKELSIEEKAKAYDKALEKAREWYNDSHITIGLRGNLEDIFPELKENEDEDERIRKSLIELFKDMEWDDSILHDYNMDKDKTIAWLEKQVTPQVRTGIEWVDTIDDACDKRYSEEYAEGEYCHEQSFKWGFQEGVDWLEKQGEKKSTDKIQIGKEYKCIASPRYSTFMIGKIYKPEDKFLCSFMNFCSDCFEPIEDSEQIDLASNTDNVETKFKVKYAGSEYSVQEVKDIAGITFYGIEDELNHIDYIKADSCEIINGGYGIKENGCSFPTKSIMFSEQKPSEREGFVSIPFGAFDSELIEETITIPDGCVATIEGNKIHIKKK